MPFKDRIFNKNGEELEVCPFIFEVNLDDLENFNNVQLICRPVDPGVVIGRDYFDSNNKHVETHRIHNCFTDMFYNDEDDEIILYVFTGFDVAVFNMCSLLGIGRIDLDSGVPYEENGFAPVHDKVTAITFTLEEFKQLDGLVALIKFTPHFVLFKGLLIGANYIHEDVKTGDVTPDFRSEKLLRGEKLFLWD